MKRIAAAVMICAAGLAQQPEALLPNAEAIKLYQRMVQLMESTTAAVPGLARAGAPVIENTRQAVVNLQGAASQQDGAMHYNVLVNARAYLALSDAIPKPFPFPQEAQRQFRELRESAERAEAHFEALLRVKESQLRNPDRDQLSRYREENLKAGPPRPDEPRVVFLGDSITDFWRLNEYFPGRDYINRGISGQITSQMLARMKADVIERKPAAMVVLAGTNDIARGVPVEVIQDNLEMIADLAEAHKIRPVFASILPVHDYNKDKDPALLRSNRRPMQTIRELNQWLAAFCQKRKFVYLDYFSAMVDGNGWLKADLADDGLHPNGAGYRVMAPLVHEALLKVAAPAPEEKRRRRFPF
jgi:lysophospholipase L1-like esterase